MTNARPAGEDANTPHYVYRVFDARDRLLYIGCTRDVTSRMSAHRSWGNQNPSSYAIFLHGERVDVTEYPTYDEARAAEKASIYAEAPHFNFAHNGRRFTGRASERVEILPTYEPAPQPADPELDALLADLEAKFTKAVS